MADKSTTKDKRGFALTETSPLDGRTVFDAAQPSRRAARFRSLTLVGATPVRFGEAEPRGTLKIRFARMFEERRAEALRARSREAEPSVPGAQQDPHLYTFLAHDAGQFVGSLSVRLDSPRGLVADELYRDETAVLRDHGCRVCEFLNLTVDMNSAPKRALACLFHAAYLFTGAVWSCDYGVLEAPARHAEFFRASLGFEPIGEERLNQRVSTVEQLLCVHLNAVLERLTRVGGRPDAAAQDATLFPYGFSPEESVGVVRRLASLALSGNG
ncbi:MAG: N-acyl amino acid synthase FeeM domain-containing protein [Bacteroidota bacterium]